MTLRVLAPAALLLALYASAQQPGSEPLSLAERAYVAGKIYSSAQQFFAHWADVPGLDVDAAYRKYLDGALAAQDRAAFIKATLEFLAAFRNSHTTMFDAGVIRGAGPLPFNAKFLSGRWVITESWTPGIKTGDVIESIDGQPFEQFFAGLRRFLPASTDQWARVALFTRVSAFAPYAHLLPKRFVLRLDGGREVTVNRNTLNPPPVLVADGHWLEEGRAAYIRIPSFSAPEYEKRALELLGEFKRAALLVVDVRGNSGGSTPGELTSMLMDRPYRWWTESTPVAMPYFRLRAAEGQWQYQPFGRPEFLWRNPQSTPRKEAFAGKLVLLIDAGCHSACEDFAMPFKDNGRATLVGETTAGSTGQPYMLQPTEGMTVLIGAKREMFPDGSRFEGIGIKPDVEVSPSPEDIRKSVDPVLDAARKLAPTGR